MCTWQLPNGSCIQFCSHTVSNTILIYYKSFLVSFMEIVSLEHCVNWWSPYPHFTRLLCPHTDRDVLALEAGTAPPHAWSRQCPRGQPGKGRGCPRLCLVRGGDISALAWLGRGRPRPNRAWAETSAPLLIWSLSCMAAMWCQRGIYVVLFLPR